MMNEAAIPVIAIDGPTASGKGTVAQRVAQTLGFHYLDSGALYRIVGLACLRSHVDFSDMAAVTAHAIAIAPRFVCGRVLLGDEDISKEIRTEEVGTAASLAAQIPSVRDALFELQRRERRQPGLVADGRDMGSVIFPDACLKVFLTASVETRARRRYKQLIEKGIDVKLDALVSEMAERDRRDMQRTHAPLVPAEGAKILDSSCLTIQETVVKILHWYDQVSLGGAD
ncbi:(d)CMP kinase [Mesosutterella faecium]